MSGFTSSTYAKMLISSMVASELPLLHTKHKNRNLVVAFIFLLSIMIVGQIFPTQLYAITICETSIILSNCGNESSSTSASSTSNSEIAERPQSDMKYPDEIPLIRPDVSPRDEDLRSAITDGDHDPKDAGENNDDKEDDNKNDNSKDSADDNVDVDLEGDGDSGNDRDKSSIEGPSLIPFP
jgi:hypothetical protein